MGAIAESQRQLFRLLEEFFSRATGTTYDRFVTRGSFAETIRANADRLSKLGEVAYTRLERDLRSYYAENRLSAFGEAGSFGGIKTVLGGTSRFLRPQLSGVRKMALYADTILIPDPILPWIEDARTEERFRHVQLLQTVYWLLHLKPLIDADLPQPAIVLVPSWERSLEAHDATTQERQQRLVTGVLSYHLQLGFPDYTDLARYSEDHESSFLAAVDHAGLFVAPGADAGEPLSKGMARYRAYLRTWRSPKWLEGFNQFPEGVATLYALSERFGPIYHLLENADELSAQPMLCSDVHWFHYTRVVESLEGQLSVGGYLDPATVAKLRALQGEQVAWLDNVPFEDLARLRIDNANETFRRRIDEWTRAMNGASLEDIDRVASEMARGMSMLLGEHSATIKRIRDDYQVKHKQTLVAATAAASALFLPALAPLVGTAAPLTLLTKYAWDKIGEGNALAGAARSLTGILAAAKSQVD